MCYNKQQLEMQGDEVSRRYKVSITGDLEFTPNYHVSGFDHPKLAVITADDPHVMQQYEWGLIPWWVKDFKQADELRKQTLNAKSETVFEKPSFRDSTRQKRCIIPINGYFDWYTLDPKRKYPFFIYPKNDSLFSVGGIYERWVDKATGEIHNTYSVVTTDANPLAASIHNLKRRMPLILSSDNELKWLDQTLSDDEIRLMMVPFNENEMAAHTISKLITSRKEPNNVPQVTDRFVYPELLALKFLA